MRLSRSDRATLAAIAAANGSTFTELVMIAKLDPATAFREADLSGIDFAECDLSGYDFSGADLTGSSFTHASIEGAIFHRAETAGTKWPRGQRPRLSTAASAARPFALHPHQVATVDAVVKALSKKTAKPSLTLLPPGVGQTAIIVEALRRIRDRGNFAKGIILTETAAIREQIIDSLRAADLRAAEFPRPPERRLRQTDEIWVATYARIRNTINTTGYGELEELFDGISHAVLIGMPGLMSNILKVLADFGIGRAMVFGEVTARRSVAEDPTTTIDIPGIFPRATYVYDIDTAIVDGVLGMSELIQKAFGEGTPGADDPVAPATISGLRLVAQDFGDEILSREAPSPSMLLARRISDVDALADHLQSHLDAAHEGGRSPFKIVPFSSHHGHDVPIARLMEDNEAVIVTTPGHVERSSLRPVNLIGVTMSQVTDRLAVRLMYPPAAAGLSRVIDYGGGLSKAVKFMDVQWPWSRYEPGDDET